MASRFNHLYEFGEFRLDPAERLLLRDEKPVPLTPKAFETLLVLIGHRGHLVEKDELMKQVWADAAVEEANLARNIWTLRKALGDGENGHRYIETVPKLGYRFVAPVREVSNELVDVVVQRRVRARIVTDEESPPGAEGSAWDDGARAGSGIPRSSARAAVAGRTNLRWWSGTTVLAAIAVLAVL